MGLFSRWPVSGIHNTRGSISRRLNFVCSRIGGQSISGSCLFSCRARLKSRVHLSGNLDPLLLKALVFFACACEQEGVCLTCRAALDRGDHVTATQPVRLIEVRGRPVRRMIGVRVVEADNLQSLSAAFSLEADQLLRSNRIPVMRSIGRGVPCRSGFFHFVHRQLGTAGEPSQQHTAALVRICLLSMLPNRVVDLLAEPKH